LNKVSTELDFKWKLLKFMEENLADDAPCVLNTQHLLLNTSIVSHS